MVIWAIRARDDSAPVTPCSRICRVGVDSRRSSRFIRKPSLPSGSDGVLRHRGDRHERQQAEDGREPSQNACPMPM